MKLSVMCRILETVSLGLDIFGRVPDLTVIDAIAVGTFGANAVLMHSINSVEVCISFALMFFPIAILCHTYSQSRHCFRWHLQAARL